MTTRRTYTQETIDGIIAERLSGTSSAKLAKRHGVPRRTISQWIQDARDSGRLDAIREQVAPAVAAKLADAGIADSVAERRVSFVKMINLADRLAGLPGIDASDLAQVARSAANANDAIMKLDMAQAEGGWRVDGIPVTDDEMSAAEAAVRLHRQPGARTDAEIIAEQERILSHPAVVAVMGPREPAALVPVHVPEPPPEDLAPPPPVAPVAPVVAEDPNAWLKRLLDGS